MTLKRIISSCLLAIATVAMSWATNVIVDGTNVRFRLGPSTNHAILHDGQGKVVYAKKGEAIPYLKTQGNFYLVKYMGEEVFISRDFTHLSEGGSTTATKATAKGKPATTAMDKKLIGKHMLSLQWISWDYFGSVNITKEGDNYYRCVGEQLDRTNVGDYVKLDGYISAVDELNLVFNGTIKMKIYHLNGGEEYVRDGRFNFKSTQGRKYWRMQEMDGPDGEVDYVDIYMLRKK